MFLSLFNKKNVYLVLSMSILTLLLSMTHIQNDREALAARLSPALLRLHILANSDSDSDQAVKLEVRSLLLDYLSHEMTDTPVSSCSGKESTIAYIHSHKKELESLANSYLEESGFSYNAQLQIVNCYFPTRLYNRLIIPCGYYDAVRITLGRGGGHNWWCVLYPRFCFTDSTCKAVPQESLDYLKENLKKDDFLVLKDSRPDIKFSFFLFPTLQLQSP